MYNAYGHSNFMPICGLYYSVPLYGTIQKTYLPQVEVKAHASIFATTSRTVLQQTFVNPSSTRGIREVRYAFPLYDGVSVVGFSCHVGNRLIVGEVKEKEKAKQIYENALARGETAGLLEQLPDASDVFTTTIGNIPPGARVVIDITYLGELKHDMEVDGIRFTIPTSIFPRYGNVHGAHINSLQQLSGKISITVDAEMPEGSFIQGLQSPSHPIAMSMGTTSANPTAVPSMSRASATLSLGVAHLDADFVLQVIAKDTGVPKAVLETHPTIPNHRALMATLVPKFSLPPEKPEVVFVCDQSGSMGGSNMTLAIEALQVFLKSLPVGVKFNICSFGSRYSFLFPRSASYGQDTLAEAVSHASRLQANYGGTEMLAPIKATIENRYRDMPLDIILLTDGEIWNQQDVFSYLNQQIQENKVPIRVFTLGIGRAVSHSLIEGIAKAGNGFSQSVQDGEKMNSKVVRMLKGALSPHVNDYMLEVKYSNAEMDDDFEIIEKVADSLKIKLDLNDKANVADDKKPKNPISLFDIAADPDKDHASSGTTGVERYAHLPPIPAPNIIQAPQFIPTLFAFNRTTVYLLLGPDTPRATPTSVVLRGTSKLGPLELEIPIQVLDAPGVTIHQLAAKKAVSELEQGRGWLASASDADGQLLKERFDGRFIEMVEREAVRLGVQFQVGGKWCSFVATEKRIEPVPEGGLQVEDGWAFLEDEQPDASEAQLQAPGVQQSPVQQMQQQQQRMQRQQSDIMWKSSSKVSSSIRPFGNNSAPAPPPPFGVQPPPIPGAVGGGALFGGSSTGRLVSSAPSQRPSYAMPALASPASPFGAASPSLPTTTSLFGAASPGLPAASLFGAPGASPQGAQAQSFGAPAASDSATALRDYQMGLMLCEQQNRKRLTMARVAAASPASPQYTSSSPGFSPSSPGSASPSPQEIMHLLIAHQSFSGQFAYTPTLLSWLHVTVADFTRALEAVFGAVHTQAYADVLATALGVAFLEEKVAECRGEWELVVDKARVWMEGEKGDVERVLEVARGLLVG